VRTHRVWSIGCVCALLTACSLVIDADTDELAHGASGDDSGDGAGDGDTDGQPDTGACADDADCSDGDPCNGTERCDPADPASDAQGCVAGAPPDCGDDVACTVDRCESGVGCTHKPDSTRCDDGVDCTIDVCSLGQGCHNDPNQQRCDFCRPGSVCDVEQGCVGGFANDCSDGDLCTVDQCDVSSLSCLHFGSCEGGPDSCDDAQEIFLNAGRAVAGGSFDRVTATYDGACGDPGGRDAVYKVRIDAVSDIVLDTTASDARTIVAVGTQCSEAGFGLACASLVDGERGARLVIHRYDPQLEGTDLFILIDAADGGENGEYVLTVDVTPVAPDACNATSVRLPVGATLLGFMDALEPANNWGTQQGSCQLATGPQPPESIVSFVADDDDTFRFVVTSDAFAPALYARDRCNGNGPNDELACDAAVLTDTRAEIELDLRQDDEAFLFVDAGKDHGAFVLKNVP
jgi:hypothetical protein